MSYLDIPYRRREEVKRAEEEAWRMMRAVGLGPFDFFGNDQEDQWIATFGDTKEELEEHLSTLARRYRAIPFWRRRERSAVMAHYISVEAMIRSAHGLEAVWGI